MTSPPSSRAIARNVHPSGWPWLGWQFPGRDDQGAGTAGRRRVSILAHEGTPRKSGESNWRTRAIAASSLLHDGAIGAGSLAGTGTLPFRASNHEPNRD